ncbi:MAG TPA: SRPBCC family protein [Acidimicrobiia bacterium]|nr:SRPBCC family protein [Acidimicrobiia bacterium]
MTVRAEATRVVPATSQEVLEFVLDLERYRQADTKIGRVVPPIELDENDEGVTRYWGRMRGTPPAPDTNLVRLRRWSELTFTGAPRQPARLVVDFTGRFLCTDTDDGCRVTHGYELDFRRPFRWLYEPLLDGWLQTELEAELDRVHAILSGVGRERPS